MAEHTYTVLRQHYGDRMYEPGDEREAAAADVQHLIDNSVLELKAARPVHNKALKPAQNKAE